VTLIEAAQALGRYTSHDWISEVDVPTVIVVTRDDRLVPATRQRKLAAVVPGATVHEVDGDHPVGIREPLRFAPVLLEACLDVSGRVAGGRVATVSFSGKPSSQASERRVAGVDQVAAADVAVIPERRRALPRRRATS
jgi:hypothetical protein